MRASSRHSAAAERSPNRGAFHLTTAPPDSRTGADSGLPVLQSMTVGDVLAQQARIRLAEKGFEVLNSSAVKVATKDLVPTSPEMAAQILREVNLDAAALYIEVRRWEPTPDSRGMKADGVIVALDVMMVDPKTGRVMWQVTLSLPADPSLRRRVNGPS